MKHYPLWLLVTALMIAGCHSPTNPRDLLGIAYIGGIDKKSHQFAPAAGIDSAYAALVTKITGGLDTLRRYISEMPEISKQHYTSKDEAKKQFIAAGNADFSAVLNKNPLPASIELTINDDYCTIEKLTQIKKKLESLPPFIISEVTLPVGIHPELRKVRTEDCIFHFKT